VSGTPTTAVFGTQTPISLTTTCGSSGAVTFKVTGTGCTVTGTSLKGTRATTCTVIATQGTHKSTATFTFTAPVAQVSYTVTFDSNGAWYQDPTTGQNLSNNYKVYQAATSTTALKSNVYTQRGTEFIGWATTSTGPVAIANQGNVAYANGADYAFTADAYLYAVWLCDPKRKSYYPLTDPWVEIDGKKRTGQESASISFNANTWSVDWGNFTAFTTEGGQSTTKGNWVPNYSGELVVTGLRRHTGYSFKVTGTNDVGCSYTSEPVHLDKFD